MTRLSMESRRSVITLCSKGHSVVEICQRLQEENMIPYPIHCRHSLDSTTNWTAYKCCYYPKVKEMPMTMCISSWNLWWISILTWHEGTFCIAKSYSVSFEDSLLHSDYYSSGRMLKKMAMQTNSRHDKSLACTNCMHTLVIHDILACE